jgi:hypothetical protein
VLDSIDDTDSQIFPQEKFVYQTIASIANRNLPSKHEKYVMNNDSGCCIAPIRHARMVHLHFISALTGMFQKTTPV